MFAVVGSHARRGIGLVLVLLILTASAGCGRPLRFPLTAGAAFEFSAYYQNDISGSTKPILSAHRDLIRTVYPVWYEIDEAGNVTDLGYDADTKKLADSAGIAIVPVVRNRTGSGADPAAVLRNGSAALAAVTKLSGLVRANDFTGLALDFADLQPNSRDDLIGFARSLWRAMHALGKRFVITVPARPDHTAAEVDAYDYRQLSRVSDFLILAAYDRHSDLTLGGPVAPLEWVDRSIAAATAIIPAGKLILAVGAYGYDWPAAGPGLAAAVSAASAYQLAQQVGAGVTFDQSAHEPTFSYSQSGVGRTVWFGDRRSVAERVALARQRGLYGVVYWRLGYEEPGFWGVVQPAAQGK